jgi:hypothetical protein
MSAGMLNILALVVLVCSAISLTVLEQTRDRIAYFAALCTGLVGGIALMVSSFVLLQDWPAQMEHFDFTEVGRVDRGRGAGMLFWIYFWPYLTALAGAIGTYAFGRWLYFFSSTTE